MRKMRNVHKIFVGISQGRDHSQYLCVDGIKSVIYILSKEEKEEYRKEDV
jgi:hypothetical protein